MGDHGSSWTMPVFVLNSSQNDVIAGDEDPIPANGNPHPEHPLGMLQMEMPTKIWESLRMFKTWMKLTRRM